jgi:hypothetical protein
MVDLLSKRGSDQNDMNPAGTKRLWVGFDGFHITSLLLGQFMGYNRWLSINPKW